jgi:uncharacterized lipoprotein
MEGGKIWEQVELFWKQNGYEIISIILETDVQSI